MVCNDTDACLVGYAGSSVTRPNHIANDVLPQAVRVMATTLVSSLRGIHRQQERLSLLHLNQKAKQSSSLEVVSIQSASP